MGGRGGVGEVEGGEGKMQIEVRKRVNRARGESKKGGGIIGGVRRKGGERTGGANKKEGEGKGGERGEREVGREGKGR